jgi:hypothetical protein
MPLALKILGQQDVSWSEYTGLPISRFDLHLARDHYHELELGRGMPGDFMPRAHEP